MDSLTVNNFCGYLAWTMYDKCTDYSDTLLRRAALCVPLGFADAGLELLRIPLLALEALVMTIINFVGALLGFENWTIRGALHNLKIMTAATVLTPVGLLMFIPNLLSQIELILSNTEIEQLTDRSRRMLHCVKLVRDKHGETRTSVTLA